MLKVSVSMMKKLSQLGLASLPEDTIRMSPTKNQGVKLELDAPSMYRKTYNKGDMMVFGTYLADFCDSIILEYILL